MRRSVLPVLPLALGLAVMAARGASRPAEGPPRFPPATGGVPLELECTVVHKEQAGRRRVVWLFGLNFAPMSEAQAAELDRFGGLEG